MIYAVVELGGKNDMRTEIYDAINAGDWYTSAIPALADADQYNAYVLEKISEEEYINGDFTLMGVVKLGSTGLVTTYSD